MIVIVSTDPHNIVETEVYLDMEALGLTARDVYLVHATSSPDKPGAGDSMPSSGSPTTIRRISHPDPVRLAEHGLWAGYHTGLGRRRERDGRSSGRRPGPGYISSARWFAGKGRRVRLRSLTSLPWLTESIRLLQASRRRRCGSRSPRSPIT